MSLFTKFFNLVKPDQSDFYNVSVPNFNMDILDSAMYMAALTGTITVYVNTSTGNDTTGDGTQSLPYKTINKAISTIPKNLNGYNGNINIAAGTYAEDISVIGFHGGLLVFTGTAGANVIINKIAFSSVEHCTFSNINITTVAGSNIAFSLYKSEVRVLSSSLFTIPGATLYGVYCVYYSGITFEGTVTINNVSDTAVVSAGYSNVYTEVIQGTGNGKAINVNSGGEFSFGTRTITGTNADSMVKGGFIANNIITTGKVMNTNTITVPGYAADATQLNPGIEGTLANKLKTSTISGTTTNSYVGYAYPSGYTKENTSIKQTGIVDGQYYYSSDLLVRLGTSQIEVVCPNTSLSGKPFTVIIEKVI